MSCPRVRRCRSFSERFFCKKVGGWTFASSLVSYCPTSDLLNQWQNALFFPRASLKRENICDPGPQSASGSALVDTATIYRTRELNDGAFCSGSIWRQKHPQHSHDFLPQTAVWRMFWPILRNENSAGISAAHMLAILFR